MAVITLGLAIGVNTTIFSVVNAVLLKALPFRDPQQPFRFIERLQPADCRASPRINISPGKIKARTSTMSPHSPITTSISPATANPSASCAQVTSSLFTTLGVQPVRGRFFLAEEDKPGANNVAVVSEAFWQRRYGRDESILQNTLTLNNKPYAIVGVMPSSFRFPASSTFGCRSLSIQLRKSGDTFQLVDDHRASQTKRESRGRAK